MHPELFTIFGFTVLAYPILALMAPAVASVGFYWEIKARRYAAAIARWSVWLDLVLAVIAGSVVGGKLFQVVTSAVQGRALDVLGPGFAAYGAMIGGLVGLGFVAWRHRESYLRTLDLVAPWTPWGHAMGRFGCYLAGCCWGAHTDARVGVVFPEGSFAHAAVGYVSVHPTQLYEALGLLVLGAVLVALRVLRPARRGGEIARYLAGYAMLRFLVEVWRGDEARGYIYKMQLPGLAEMLGLPPEHAVLLSTSQATALVMVLMVVATSWVRRTWPRRQA